MDTHLRGELSVIPSLSVVGGIIGLMAKTSTRSRITEIGEESRQRILDAAEQLFIERGYEGTTLADVGKLAGISYGSIPWHFKNKQGLLFAVAERAWNRGVGRETESSSNWIPSVDGPIDFSIRLYSPAARYVEGDWIPPLIEYISR